MKPQFKQNTMETFRLISMTDFVLEQTKNAPIEEYNQVNETFVSKVVNYANFLKQPLKLEMFVPCDENGNVLDQSDAFRSCEKGFVYSKAIERILFKGLYWERNYVIGNMPDEMIYVDEEFCQDMTIEDFFNTIISKIELTPTAIKQIGL